MSELTILLEGVKAEWKSLGEVVKLEKGKQLNKEMLALEGTYPAYNGGISYSGFTERYNYDGNKTIISQGGASAGFVNFIATKFYANAHCYVVLPHVDKVNNRYIYHVLKLNQNKLTKKQFGAGIPALKTADILNIPILIPCPDNPKKSLKIQEEIVRILDRLSEETNQLTAALQKELNLHQKQYNFYREELFKFEGKEVEWKSLGEVSKLITKGTTPKKYSECGISFIKTEAFSGSNIILKKLSFIDEETHEKELKRSMLEENDILITIAGATIGKCAIVPKEVLPANTNQALAIIRLMDVVDVKFIFHLLKSGLMKKYIELNSKGSAQPNLNLKQLNDFVIPFTSLVEQSRIVKILDDLDSKTQEITAAINTEIWLRNKQYEYYRDSLLSFQSLQTISCSSLRAEGEAIQKKNKIPMNGGGSEGEAIQKNTTTQ